jgi:hypothetical protein
MRRREDDVGNWLPNCKQSDIIFVYIAILGGGAVAHRDSVYKVDRREVKGNQPLPHLVTTECTIYRLLCG